jgi:uncharacterized membrane protein YgdD (TMEM256/DUF423 family)
MDGAERLFAVMTIIGGIVFLGGLAMLAFF